MDYDEVRGHVEGIPHMTPSQGRIIYDFILENRMTSILELGFAHGVSTCYMAAALDEIGEGAITSMDMENARDRSPSIHELLEEAGLSRYVEPIFSGVSYNWELMNVLERRSQEDDSPLPFQFCYVDGAHNWEVDGFAFFLVERLLEPGGWFLFDDLTWTYGSSPGLKDSEMVRSMTPEERTTAQVGKIFELLVRPHPSIDFATEKGDWGWARKRPAGAGGESPATPHDALTAHPSRKKRWKQRFLKAVDALFKV